MRAVLTAAFAALAIAAAPAVAEACSCLPPDVASSYDFADAVFTAKIGGTVRGAPVGRVQWRARITAGFKDCPDRRDRVIIESADNGAACGVNLQVGTEYLLFGRLVGQHGRRPVYSVGLCSYNRPVSQLTDDDRTWLGRRYRCCGQQCACVDGSPQVSCKADPCQVSSCSVAGATCVANYCGGCHAEYFDNFGRWVCRDDCQTDADCPGGNWCRPDQGGIGRCVPFVSNGASCEGFVLPHTRERCEPGLLCVPSEPTGDVPGTCADCNYEGTPYQAGDSFRASDGCNTCTCGAGNQVGCTKIGCPSCNDPARHYVSRDPLLCARIFFGCGVNQVVFSDPCGCGCRDVVGTDPFQPQP